MKMKIWGSAILLVSLLEICSCKYAILQPGFFEGDILLDRRMAKFAYERVSISNPLKLWPNGRVPYVMDGSLTSTEVNLIDKGIRIIQQHSCVRFVHRTNEQNYVRFIRGSGCYSYVGRLSSITSGQAVSIGPGCGHIGIVLHEMMHALGFFHTNSRPDRDSYVIVYYNNIKPGCQHNFQKYNTGTANKLGSPYDFHSLMHLPRNSFSKNGAYTIVSRAGTSVVLGQLNQLSQIDIQEINTLYRCSNNKGCYFSLGMESKRIPDSSISASSHMSYDRPHQARLHQRASSKGSGAWCALRQDRHQYLIVDFGSRKSLTGIATQGKKETFFDAAWVTRYTLQYKRDPSDSWQNVYQDFTGNWDDISVKFSTLASAISARYVKVIPLKWQGGICMRIELYGCDG